MVFTEADADRAGQINAKIDDGTITDGDLAELSGLALKLRDHLRGGGEMPDPRTRTKLTRTYDSRPEARAKLGNTPRGGAP